MNINNVHVLLTGGSKGIGIDIARELAKHNVRLTIVARASKQLEEISAELGAKALTCDLTDPSQVDDLIKRAEAINGSVDVLINNAALTWTASITEVSGSQLRDQLTANLLSPMDLMRQVLPSMIDRKKGTIINVASLAGVFPQPHVPGYSPAKAGLAKASYDLQREMKKHGVGINLVYLGLISGTESENAGKDNPVVAKMLEGFKNAPTATTQEVATKIVKSLLSDRLMNVVTIPSAAKPFTWLHQLPMWLLDRSFKKAFDIA